MSSASLIEGYIASEPELRFTANDYPIWSCRLRFPGTGKRSAEFNEIELRVFGKRATVLSEDSSLIKGLSVLVDGRLENDKDEDDKIYPVLIGEDVRPWGSSISKLESMEDEVATLPVKAPPAAMSRAKAEQEAAYAGLDYDAIPF